MNYFTGWYILALVAVLLIGFETRGVATARFGRAST